jgi:hypothetical protein
MTIPLCASIWLTLHLVSWHDEPGYTNGNRGAGIECRLSEHATVAAGAYRNSFGDASRYATVAFESAGQIRAGFMAGFASNYPRGNVPVGGLTLAADIGGPVLRLLLAPKVSPEGAAVAHLMLSIPITKEASE